MVPKLKVVCVAASVAFCGFATNASGQSLTEALASAYSLNPELNVARSQLRSLDETIAIARSGNRPLVLGNVSSVTSSTLTRLRTGTEFTSGSRPTALTLTFTQPLFQGFQVRNNIRSAEAAVKAQRQALMSTEQDVLLAAATAFHNVIAARAIVRLRRDDVRFLAEQVRAAEDRFEVGEGTRTDVSQAEASQAQARTLLNFAIADLRSAEATFFQLTGLRANRLRDNIDVAPRVPKSVDAAVTIGQRGHPAILAALFDVDTALFNVKSLEGQFLPSIDVTGEVSTAFNPGNGVERADNAQIGLNVSVPIYQQGLVSAQVRQAKEDLGTSRIQVDVTRDLIRQNTVAAFAAYRASVRSIQDARVGVFSAQLALQGVVEEQRVGQRTTLDVLDSQSDLVAAQITLVDVERDAEVAAFELFSAIGQLTAIELGLAVRRYEPEEHTKVVRDKWFGFRTPDGR